jgi:hypothetical protein
MPASEIAGEPLLVFDKKGVGILLLSLGVLFLAGGLGARFLGHDWAFTIAISVASLGVMWMAAAVLGERLVVTSEGVYRVDTRGLTLARHVAESTRWEEIVGVELQIRTRTSRGQRSTSYTLVFSRANAEPLRYLMGFPSPDRLLKLSEILRQRNVPSKL